MKSLATPFILCVAVVSQWTHAETADASLTGCWRAAKIVQHFKDGSKGEDTSGRCTLQYRDDQLVSSCASAAGTVTSTYRYKVERPNFYLATMTGSTFRTTLMGVTREYEYGVEGDRLKTAINLKVAEPAPTSVVRVETETARMTCP
jgi:hypothetical protein